MQDSPQRGKVAQTTPSNTGALGKLYANNNSSLAISAKVRVDYPEADKRPFPMFNMQGSNEYRSLGTIAFLNNDHFVFKFASGVLKSCTYTVALDETVRDILNKTAFDTATFQVR